MTSSIFKGILRISLFPLSSSDIFSFVGFLVCFFLKTVALKLSEDVLTKQLTVCQATMGKGRLSI